MQMRKHHICEDLLMPNIMSMHGYSSQEIACMDSHHLTDLYNMIFGPIDKGDLYTIEEDEDDEGSGSYEQ